MSITTNALAIGWTRDRQGRVTKYHLRPVCNCITTFCGGYKNPQTGMGNTTPYVLIELR